MSNRGLRVSSFVLALAVVGAACSAGGSKGSPPDSSTTTAPSSTASTAPGGSSAPTTAPASTASTPTTETPTTVPSGYAAIAALMLVNVPSGFVIQPDRVADTGATNLAKAIQDAAAADGATVLRQTGFTLGYQRSWVAADGGDSNSIFLYQFATPAGAAQYTTSRAAEIQGTLAPGAIKTFPVLLAGAVGLHSESATASFAAVVVAKGVYSIEAVATDGPSTDQSLAVAALANAQYQRLP